MKCKGEDMCNCNASCKASAMQGDVEYLGSVPEGYTVAFAGGQLVARHDRGREPPLKFNMETKEWEGIPHV